MKKKGHKMIPRRLRPLRENLYKHAWESYKGIYDMQDIAKVFRISLPQFWKIVNKEEHKE